jgi:hypothetical protein
MGKVARAMADDNRRNAKTLTSDHLFTLLSTLPENIEADRELGKRRCCRWLLRVPAELYYTAQDGTEIKTYANIRDISITGIGLLTKNGIPIGTPAELLLPLEDGYYAIGTRIAHCTQTIGGWKIGCQLLIPDAIHMVPMVEQAALLDRDEFERNGR